MTSISCPSLSNYFLERTNRSTVLALENCHHNFLCSRFIINVKALFIYSGITLLSLVEGVTRAVFALFLSLLCCTNHFGETKRTFEAGFLSSVLIYESFCRDIARLEVIRHEYLG